MLVRSHSDTSFGYSESARLGALAAFVATVFLLGGSSRHDTATLVLLRPLSALFLAYAAAGLSAAQWREFRFPIILLAALAVLMWLQLIPLPPSIWADLPSRAPIQAIGVELGVEQVWRPLSLAPSKTWNSLFSLLVPAAALLLFALQSPAGRKKAWILLLMAAAASMALGVLQILGGSGSGFYYYNYQQSGFAPGLFSNRNHQGVFLATAILICTWWFSSIPSRGENATLRGAAALAPIILLVPMVFLAGSRAGLLVAALSLLAAFWLLAMSPLMPATARIGRHFEVSRGILLSLVAAILALLVAVVVYSSRDLALGRLLDDAGLEDLRWQVFPIIQAMGVDQFPWGAGFGSFEYVYRMYEPVDLLGPKYLNNAHNDWAQWFIEGGLPAIVILAAFLVAFFGRVVAAWRMAQSEERRRRLMAAIIILLLALASVVDYPLRAPSMMAYFCFAFATLWMTAGASDSSLSERRR